MTHVWIGRCVQLNRLIWLVLSVSHSAACAMLTFCCFIYTLFRCVYCCCCCLFAISSSNVVRFADGTVQFEFSLLQSANSSASNGTQISLVWRIFWIVNCSSFQSIKCCVFNQIKRKLAVISPETKRLVDSIHEYYQKNTQFSWNVLGAVK